MGKYKLEVKPATDADLIKWLNLGVSTTAKCFFGALNILVMSMIVAFNTIVVIYGLSGKNYFQESILQEVPIFTTDKPITLEQAYQDQTGKMSSGIMSAYCSQESEAGIDAVSIEFPDGRFYCQELKDERNQVFLLQLLAAIIIATLNPIACAALQKVASTSRRRTMP